jgi:indolepyruvate ferredoxin oxidoreductase
MAYKDEYEVARLHTDPGFAAGIAAQFEGDYRLQLHLAPPLLARPGPDGRPRKLAFGPWLLPVLRLLKRLKPLRGTPFDPFGHTAERRAERALIGEYRAAIEALLPGLNAGNRALALQIARLPQQVRGYGPVKAAQAAEVLPRWRALRAQWPVQGAALAGAGGAR